MITPANLVLMAVMEQKRPDRMWVTALLNAEQTDHLATLTVATMGDIRLRNVLVLSSQTEPEAGTLRAWRVDGIKLRSITHSTTQTEPEAGTLRAWRVDGIKLRSITHSTTQTEPEVGALQVSVRTPILLKSLQRRGWAFPDVPQSNGTARVRVSEVKLTKVL